MLFLDHFNIYTREAGAGLLSIGIEGPSNAKIFLEQRPNGFLGVSYKVEKPGMDSWFNYSQAKKNHIQCIQIEVNREFVNITFFKLIFQ